MNAASSFNEEDLNRSLEEEIARYENMATQVSDRAPSNIVHQPTTAQLDLKQIGNLSLVFVAGVAAGGLYVSTFCNEQFNAIGFGPSLVSMAPGIKTSTTDLLSSYQAKAKVNRGLRNVSESARI